MSDWVCSKCGGDQVSPLASRPSLDDRYAVGHCRNCTPVKPKEDPAPRATVALVRGDVWRPEIVQQSALTKAERKLLKDYGAADQHGVVRGKRPRYLNEHDQKRAAALLAKIDAEAAARRS